MKILKIALRTKTHKITATTGAVYQTEDGMELFNNTDALMRLFLALTVVLGLMMFTAWVAKMLGLQPLLRRRDPCGTRLRLIDTLSIGSDQRLVLIGRDEVEHLVYIGAQGACVVESGIRSHTQILPPAFSQKTDPVTPSESTR